MKIAMGSDEAGFDLKNQIKEYIEAKGHEVVDTGCYSKDPVLYPLMAEAACKKIVDDLPAVMKKYNITNLRDIIGGAH